MCKYVKPLINLLLRCASNAPFDVSLVTNSIFPWILSNFLSLCRWCAVFFFYFYHSSFSVALHCLMIRIWEFIFALPNKNEWIHKVYVVCDTYFVISLTLAILFYYYYCYRYVNKHRLIKLLPIRTIWDCSVCFMNAV